MSLSDKKQSLSGSSSSGSFSQKFSSSLKPSASEKEQTIVGEKLFKGKSFINRKDFVRRAKEDAGGKIYRAGIGKMKELDVKSRERLTAELVGGGDALPKDMKLALSGWGKIVGENFDPKELKRAQKELNQGKYGIFKGLSEKQRKELKKYTELISKNYAPKAKNPNFDWKQHTR